VFFCLVDSVLVSNFSIQTKLTNMKKWLIGSLVGAIIVFAWSFFSWTISGLHDGEAKYLDTQDAVMQSLNENIKADGVYMLPSLPPGSSMEEMEAMGNAHAGKPWAMITYKTSYSNDMISPMIRGFLINLVVVLLLISILMKGGAPDMKGAIVGSVIIGIIGFLWGPYMQHNWFQTPWEAMTGHMVEAVVPWALCGAWLGWWLRR
jgi:hypothetical protein